MKMHSVVILATAAAVLLSALAGCGPQDGTGGIEGTVTAEGGHPVGGMEVVILDSDGEPTTASARTDTKGHYRIEDTPPGTYDVAVHNREGERLVVRSIAVGGGEDSVLDITVPIEVDITPRSLFGTPLPQRRLTLEELKRTLGR